MPLVSVIVVSHNRPEYLPPVLDSIVGQSYQNLEIIVVDNQSRSSDEIEKIVSRYPGVKLIRNRTNLGFTGGMNKGIEAASGAYAHLTLDDIILERDCILHLAQYIKEHPSSGLLAGILYNETGDTIICAGGEALLEPVYKKRFWGAGEKEAGQFTQPFTVNHIPGGMIFSSLRLLRQLKGFRQDFFIYSEDIEICERVLKLGYDITIVPQAKVFVIDAPHNFNSEGIAFHKLKNFFAVYLLHARLRVLPEFYLRYGVINLLRALFSNRKIIWPMVKAWGWFLVKMPFLLRERFRRRSFESGWQ